MLYAHSLDGRPVQEWEPLVEHHALVASLAGGFAAYFGWEQAGRLLGSLHDIGKCSDAFQNYIRQTNAQKSVDHSTAGAREAVAICPGPLGTVLAFALAGHHAGLSDYPDLQRRLTMKSIEPYSGWKGVTGPLPSSQELRPTTVPCKSSPLGFGQAMLTRMLFSCLVDADSLATEQFSSVAKGGLVQRGVHASLAVLRERLETHMRALGGKAASSDLNAMRAEIRTYAIAQAERAPGLFTFTVPTGGGKTLASLSFALEHAVRHGLRRVIYVIPFTSIIEQTAAVFRSALGSEEDVLEHHASFDWDPAGSVEAADCEGADGRQQLRRAAENWDIPIVVTTAVQFFETLFANRRARARKLHNVSGAVIVLDEAQTLPVSLLRPSLAALQELAANYGSSVVVCTATQPAWRRIDGALPLAGARPIGLDIGADRELAPDPVGLYRRARRVAVERILDPIEDDVIVDRFTTEPRMLCIVNSRAHARTLYDLIAHLPGATHLTTLMCPRHRRRVLEQARAELAEERPVRLVATSLIEAGVDIDFPEVWRAAAGLDSIAQAAGRCNREGKRPEGRCVVFVPSAATPPHELAVFWQAAQPALRAHDDPLSLEAVHRYFHELYFVRGADGLDAAMLDGERFPIMAALAERARDATFPFASITRAYRLIAETTKPVIVPYDALATDLLDRLARPKPAKPADLRQLQQYVVGLPARARADWLAAGVLTPVHPSMDVALLRFHDLAHYKPATGVDLVDTMYRDPVRNIMC